jgi:hypothetical protein
MIKARKKAGRVASTRITFFTKLYGDWSDLGVRVEAVDQGGTILILGAYIDAFSKDNLYILLHRLTVERLKREARIALRRDGVRLMLTPDGEEAS